MYAYCLHCSTVKCAMVAESIRRKLVCEAFSPRIVQRKWIKGKAVEEVHDYLPGYVFVYSQEPIDSFEPLRSMEGVLRCLGERENGYRLEGEDLRFAGMLHANAGVIGIMKAYREGERVKLARDAMGGFEGEIVRLDRRKGRAQIQFGFDGSQMRVWVGYEMIEET